MLRVVLRELGLFAAVVGVQGVVGLLTGLLFEELAFFFGTLMVIAFGAVIAYFYSFRVRDTFGPPWGLVSFVAAVLAGGYLGLVMIVWTTHPLNK